MPIRVRLTLWYLLVFGVALIALTATGYFVLANNLRGEIDRTIVLKAAEIHMATASRSEMSTPLDASLAKQVLSPIDEFATPGVYLQILNSHGAVLETSANLQGQQLPVDPAVIAQALEGKQTIVTLAAGFGEKVRVVTMPMVHDNTVFGLVQVGQSLHNYESTVRTIGFYLFLSVVGTLFVAGVAGWFMAGQAMSRIDQITRTAQLIETSRDLGKRIEFKGPQDEIGRLVSTLNDMIARIEETFRLQRRFVADSSHELRTPLTVIRGNADLLERDIDEEGRRESVQSIKREAERMSKIVSDLLLMAQLDRQQTAERRPVQLDIMVMETFRRARLLSEGHKVELGPVDAVAVQGDADQLRRMLWNLVENAIKYTPPDGSIKLSLYQSDARAVLEVADTGIGIGPDDLPYIFDRFYRVDKARSRAQGGTGLGLAIAKSIAEMHGGTVSVASILERGSTFTVRLNTIQPILINT